jgi:DNA-binding CsgD family transcriptional regulator
VWPRQKHPFERTVPEARAEGHAPISLEIDPETASRLRRLASRRGEAPEALACGLLARGLDVELRRHQAEASLDRLTPRQRDVAWLASQGNTNRQIAAALYVSTETVKTHMAHVLGKFGLHTKADLRLLLADLCPPPGASRPARLPEALRSLSVELDPVRG